MSPCPFLAFLIIAIAEVGLAVETTSGMLDVRDFGAVGDGMSVNTQAIQSAIDTCNRDRGATHGKSSFESECLMTELVWELAIP